MSTRKQSRTKASGKPRGSWKPMKAKFVGRIDDVVKRGSGKLSIPSGDPGEPTRKPRGRG